MLIKSKNGRQSGTQGSTQPRQLLSLDQLKSAQIVSGADEVRRLSPERADVQRMLTERMTRGVASSDVLRRDMSLGTKTRAVDESAMTVDVWASDQRVDRHGDIVMQSWDFTNFEENPLILFNHDWEGLPMAQAVDWGIEKRSEKDYEGPALRMTLQFKSEADTSWDWGERIFRLISARLLNATSVGFYPGEVIWVQDNEERAEYGLGPFGYIYDKNELIELSVVTVPSNVGASVIRGVGGAGLKAGDLRLFRELRRRELRSADAPFARFMESDSVVREIYRSLFGDRLPVHREYEEPIELGDIDVDDDEAEVEGGNEGSDAGTIGRQVLDRLDELTEALDGITEALAQRKIGDDSRAGEQSGESERGDYIDDLLAGLSAGD